MEGKEKQGETKAGASRQLALGLLFGVAFGFLLQKGGVAKYNVLIGVLLLEDFTVIKVMLTAIVVGMVGHLRPNALGLVKLHIKPTRYAANILGGLLFGVGFALLAYCPGTGAAALGQGNYDAIAGVLGLMAGSYLFAEASGVLGRTLLKLGRPRRTDPARRSGRAAHAVYRRLRAGTRRCARRARTDRRAVKSKKTSGPHGRSHSAPWAAPVVPHTRGIPACAIVRVAAERVRHRRSVVCSAAANVEAVRCYRRQPNGCRIRRRKT